MKVITTGLAAAGLLALAACGGGSENKAANTVVEDVNVIEDNLLDDNLLGTEPLANDTGNAADANAVATNGAGNGL